jgi:phage gp46-like protein
MDQQGDVILYQTTDGGNITVTNGIVNMAGGLDTAAYLSLFGGNEGDDGRADNIDNWWANLSELDPVNQYRSETQYIIESLPATSYNLLRVEQAAQRDLQWFLDQKIASSVSVVASLVNVNTLRLLINIEARGEESNFEYVENWRGNT